MHTEILARGLCIQDGRVLLCQNKKHEYFYLPGGHVEFGEPAAEALRREMIEETGQPAEVGPLLLTSEHAFTQGGTPRHEINLVFAMVFHVKHPESREDDIAFRWLDLAAVTDADIRPLAIRAWLAAGGATSGGPWLTDIPRPQVGG